jgi:hypothetical protein
MGYCIAGSKRTPFKARQKAQRYFVPGVSIPQDKGALRGSFWWHSPTLTLELTPRSFGIVSPAAKYFVEPLVEVSPCMEKDSIHAKLFLAGVPSFANLVDSRGRKWILNNLGPEAPSTSSKSLAI